MKSIKLVAVATIVAFALVSTSMADGFHTKPKKSQECSLVKACQCPSLVHAIIMQVDPIFLINNQQTYTVTVYCNNCVFKITGTRAQWIWFFRQEWSVLLKKTTTIVYDD